jgi:phosphonate transport system substrate-binding protein
MNKIVILLIALIGCNYALQAQSLRIATYQYADNNRIKNIQPFADHLKTVYSIDATVTSYPTVHAFIAAIQKDEVDIALINTFGYLLLQTSDIKYPMKPLLALDVDKNAKDNYKTAILTYRGSAIRSMKDIKKLAKQSRLVLVAKGSTSGNLVPRLALSNIGIPDAENGFASFSYAGTHAAAVEAMINRQADIAAMGNTEYEKYSKMENSPVQLVWLSPEIPLGPVLFNNKLNEANLTLIQKAFLELHSKDSKALESIKTGWSEAKQATKYIRVNDSFYNSFRKTLGKKKDLNRILEQFAN